MSDYDPYRAPVAELGGTRPSDTAGSVPPEIVDLMRQTKPWVTFMAIVGFIGVVFIFIAGLAIALFGKSMGKGGLPPAAGAIYWALGGLYIFPSLYLFRYGTAIRRVLDGAGMPALTEALGRQKSFWRFVGISMAVVMVIYALALVGMVGFGMLGGFKH
jgi:hypothetical protein